MISVTMGSLKLAAAAALRGFRDFLLRIGRVIDRRAILSAGIIPLAVECGRVVEVPEPGKDLLVGDFLGVENDVHHLGMTRVAIADVLVARVSQRATHVARCGGVDAVKLLISRFDTPETTRAQCGGFRSCGDFWHFGRFLISGSHDFLRFAGNETYNEEQ